MKRWQQSVALLLLLWMSVGCDQVNLNPQGVMQKQTLVSVGTDRNESKTINAKAGDELTMDLNLNPERGNIEIVAREKVSLANSSGVIYRQKFSRPTEERIIVPITDNGRYNIIVKSTNFSGQYKIRWELHKGD